MKFLQEFRSGFLSARGFSLIELLVSMAIGLIVTLAITSVLINSEKVKLTSTKLTSAIQTGAYSSLTLDRAIRSAGSGFNQARAALNCLINAGVNTPMAQQYLPPQNTLPAPFGNIVAGTPIRLAPALILDGVGANGSDQIVVMAGTHGYGENPRTVSPGSATAISVTVDNSMGMTSGDLVLISDNVPGAGCMVQQIGAPVNQNLPMSGPYFNSVGTTRTLANFGTTGGGVALSSLGWINPVAGGISNPPTFQIFGLGTDGRFSSFDFLNPGAGATAMAEGVFTIQALYGIGTPEPPVPPQTAPPPPPIFRAPLNWVAPTGPVYGIGAFWGPIGQLPAAATAAQGTLATIKAIRVAMVFQSNLEEKSPEAGQQPATPGPLILFPDLPVAQQITIPLTSSQQNFRYRIVDTIIPIRNI